VDALMRLYDTTEKADRLLSVVSHMSNGWGFGQRCLFILSVFALATSTRMQTL